MTQKYTFVALVALLLLSVAPSAYADSGSKSQHAALFGADFSERFEFFKHHSTRDEYKEESGKRKNQHENVTLIGTVTHVDGSTVTLSTEENNIYSVAVEGVSIRGGVVTDITVGDRLVVIGIIKGEAFDAKRIINITELQASVNAHAHAIVGVVTSIGTSSFTIDPIGSKSTTTVEFTSDTEFKKKHGDTSLSSLLVGSHVLVKGTTTTSTEDGDTLVADIVKIFEKGFGNLTSWFWAK